MGRSGLAVQCGYFGWLLSFCCSTDVAPASEGYPMREWSIRVYLLGPNGDELPATIFDKVTYKLHPTFANPTRSVLSSPRWLWGGNELIVGDDG